MQCRGTRDRLASTMVDERIPCSHAGRAGRASTFSKGGGGLVLHGCRMLGQRCDFYRQEGE